MALRLEHEGLSVTELTWVKAPQKPFSCYQTVTRTVLRWKHTRSAKVPLGLVAFVGTWGANYKSLKRESHIEGKGKLESVAPFLDAS